MLIKCYQNIFLPFCRNLKKKYLRLHKLLINKRFSQKNNNTFTRIRNTDTNTQLKKKKNNTFLDSRNLEKLRSEKIIEIFLEWVYNISITTDDGANRALNKKN